MNILLIGSGGREHALAMALARSSNNSIFAAPGNPGIANVAEIVQLDIDDFDCVAEFCNQHSIDLVVVGPEKPLSDGLADFLRAMAINVFGPSQNAARLESSKDFAKNFMYKHSIPTARFKAFHKDELNLAIDYILTQALPIVIKADGLAAGKGVVIAYSHQDAIISLQSMFSGEFGVAGERIVIEEFMDGEEATIFAVCDGNDFITLASAQDHKRIFDGDKGKNTGGMGAYSPAPIVTDQILKKVKDEIIIPTLNGMLAEGTPYIGCLYVGLMIKGDDVRVVEFNCRFGDPETQPVLQVFKGDFARLLYSASIGSIDKSAVISTNDNTACCVVLVSEGYPDKYQSGFTIRGLNNIPQDTIVYHAGTKLEDNVVKSAGGRVLGVSSTGKDLKEAIFNAYSAVGRISFENMFFRKDIGMKGLKHLKQ